MNWVYDTVAEFGHQLGIEGLNFGQHNAVQLELQSGSLLAVEPVTRGEISEVLVYFGQPVGHQSGPLLRRALAKAHFDQGGAWPVLVALRGTGPGAILLTLVRLPERGFTLQSLNHTVDYLGRWFDELRSGGN